MKQVTIFLSVILVLAVQSCKEKIEMDVPEGEQKYVIESELTTETDSSFVKITKTAAYFSKDPYPVVDNANITVNGTPFLYVGNGVYKPAVPYVATINTIYNLNIDVDGKQFTSSSLLHPMFRIDSFYQVFKPKEGFLQEGYSINYIGFDDRPKTKYTYFRLGYFDTLVMRDSMQGFKILFSSEETPLNEPYSFELPFTRFQPGDECIMIFRSVDKAMNDFILAYENQTSGAPGPFQVPPANLPTNIKGGAIGYFATYDVIRKRYKVK